MKKILIIDKSEKDIELIKDCLGQSKVDLSIEADNEAGRAFEKINQFTPDLIIIDWNILKTNIDNFREILDSFLEDNNIEIITTGNKEHKGIFKEALNFGASDYIIKPFNEEELISRTEILLNKKEKNDKLNQIIESLTQKLEFATKKAEESEKLKRAFLANISHEVRTPMNAIVGFSGLLRTKGLSEDKKQESLVYIEENTHVLLKLIDNITEISRLEAGDIAFSERKLNLHDLLTSLKYTYSRKLRKFGNKNVFLNLDVPENVNFKLVSFGGETLQQIYGNLLDNAVKYTEHGEINFGYKEIKVPESENTQVLLFVRDTGIGIAKENYKTIFEVFSKVEDKNRRYFQGAGLGLAIVKKLIDLLNGSIWVDSKIEQGSTFYFMLPNIFNNKEIKS